MQNLTAVVLCGGIGQRLRPFTDIVPKPLIPIGGRPLLEHLIRFLEASGIRRFVLCVGYKAEVIQEFTKNYQTTSEIVCVDSGDASMTDRILDARQHAHGPLLVCYGDTLANVDVEQLVLFHRSCKAQATMTLYPLHLPFGIVDLNETGAVERFREKPQLPYLINIGFFLFEPRALDLLARGSNIPTFLSSLSERHELFGYRHSGRHITVNTQKEREIAESEITEFFSVVDVAPLENRIRQKEHLTRNESMTKVRHEFIR